MSLLDGTLDAIADLPTFKPFPTGAHRCEIVSFEAKKIGTHEDATELKVRLVATMEQADPAIPPAEPGDECSFAFMLDNDTGAGFFKLAITPIAVATNNTTNLRAAMAAAKGMIVDIVMAVTHDKDKNVDYANLRSLTLV